MSDNKQRRATKGSRRAPLKATQPKSAKKQKKGPLPGTVQNCATHSSGTMANASLRRLRTPAAAGDIKAATW